MTGHQDIAIAAAAAHVSALDFSETLSEIARLAQASLLSARRHEWILAALHERELVVPTSTPEGVALPHAICDEFGPSESGVLILTLQKPILWGPHHVQIVVGLFGGKSQPWVHVRTLARIARVCSQVDARQRIMECATDAALLTLFAKECNNHE